jgi:Ni,Fe-hydrogenase I large subunit
MAVKVNIDPITRIEGHLAVSIEVEDQKIINAHSKGEMFRGFEAILRGRDPLDAQQITQRICGVCPVSHGIASILAQDEAYGITPPENGRLVRNLILGANYIQSHIIHFYHLSALDFVDIAAITQYQGKDPGLMELKAWVENQIASKVLYPAAPFLPRYEGRYVEDTELNILAIRHYLDGLEMRALSQKMAAVFAGKLPHVPTLVPGGVTEKVTAHKIAAYGSMLKKLQQFIDHKYLPDVAGVAAAFPEYFKIGKGCGNYLAYGVFPESDDGSKNYLPGGVLIDGKLTDFSKEKIAEDVKHSFYKSDSGLKPADGSTEPNPGKSGAYSWLKAPRYDGKVVEVGPLSRILVSYVKGDNPDVKKLVDGLLAKLNATPEHLFSTLGRHAARAIECKLVADRCSEWITRLTPDKPAFRDFKIPKDAAGAGLTEAPRGALGHWIEVKDHKIENYQCVVPTTWNCSPRDDQANPGPVEQALVGTPISDTKNPIEATRVVRSFDPCIACAVH